MTMLSVIAGLFTANAFEWFAHKYILHDYGRNRKGRDHYHWDHHRDVRRNDFHEPVYEHYFGEDYDRHRAEVESLLFLAAVVTPLLPIAPVYTITLYYSMWNYYHCHRKSHANPEWAKKHLPWHVDHHLGRNQDTNWCVTKPWFDYIMGTRVYTAKSETEKNPLGLDLPEWANEWFSSIIENTEVERARISETQQLQAG